MAANLTSFWHCYRTLPHFYCILYQPPDGGDTFPCSGASGSPFPFMLVWQDADLGFGHLQHPGWGCHHEQTQEQQGEL